LDQCIDEKRTSFHNICSWNRLPLNHWRAQQNGAAKGRALARQRVAMAITLCQLPE
jgi:hypothetical protein